MSDNLVKKEQISGFQALENFVNQTGLENVKTTYNTKTGTACITGTKDGYAGHITVVSFKIFKALKIKYEEMIS